MIWNAYGEDDGAELDHNTPLCDKCLNEAIHFFRDNTKLCKKHFNDLDEEDSLREEEIE